MIFFFVTVGNLNYCLVFFGGVKVMFSILGLVISVTPILPAFLGNKCYCRVLYVLIALENKKLKYF